jgi:hypothetical protein
MEIHFSSEQLEHAVRALQAIPDGVARAAIPAMNRASLAAKVSGITRVLKTYTVKRSSVANKLIDLRASKSNLVAGFWIRGARSPLTSFAFNPKRVSTLRDKVHVQVRRDSGGGYIKRGFVNVLQHSGYLAVLRREGKGRYPVEFLKGPAVAQMLNNEGVREAIEARATQVLASRFDHEIGRLLEGSAK